MIKKFIFISITFLFLSSQTEKKPTIVKNNDTYNPIVANSVDRNLENIKVDGVLKALVVYSGTSYFLYKEKSMGFEYELLQLLAEELNLKLELIISNDLDSEFEALNRREVDLIAHGMTVVNQRKWEVDFTEYLYLTRQTLVQKKSIKESENKVEKRF